ncbi:hypothetical protein PINS_up002900 [Pythium insidiosum]|nr:hypothetical protein PINS_up002900 [Pythium insidiosum]
MRMTPQRALRGIVAIVLSAVISLAAAATTEDQRAWDRSVLLTLWPRKLDATLARSTDGEKWRVASSSDDGLLVSTVTQRSIQLRQALHPAIASVELTWTPPSEPQETSGHPSTSDVIFGSSSTIRLARRYAEGLHLQLTASSSKQHPAAVEDLEQSIRALLQSVFPGSSSSSSRSSSSSELLREWTRPTSDGFLAQTVCSHDNYAMPSPFPSGVLCFSSTLLPANESASVTALFEDFFPSASSLGGSHRVVALTVRPSSRELSVRVVSLAITETSTPQVTQDQVPKTSGVHVVHAVDTARGLLSVSQLSPQPKGSREIVIGRHLLSPFALAPASSAAMEVLGDGFHRTVRVFLSSPPSCPSRANARVLLVVPLSKHMYMDLDELRRRERFGAFRVHSTTKHIEIERPSAVSKQHVVALEFELGSNVEHFNMEFPVHFRYQSPSTADHYATATVLPPEILYSCGDDLGTENANDELATLLHQWTLTTKTSSSSWRPVILASPLRAPSTPVQVPVGFIPDGAIVSIATLAVTMLGALVLMVVATSSRHKRSDDRVAHYRPKSD